MTTEENCRKDSPDKAREKPRMNYQQSIFDGTEQSLLEESLRLIREFEPIALHRHPLGYVVGYSGGKDSDVLVDLFRKANVKFFVKHNHTTLDAPETVYHIRKKFSEWTAQGIPCKIYYPRESFWRVCLDRRTLPSRQIRFCCSELKEQDIPELKFATHCFGVRKAESAKRAITRDSIELRNRKDYSDIQRFHFDNLEEVRQTDMCYKKNYFILNPLAYWSDNYLWNYIEAERIEINPLYSCGFKRVGCIGCPLSGKRRIYEFERYPKYKARYIKLCDDIVARRRENHEKIYTWKNGLDYFNFWLYEYPLITPPGLLADELE